MQRKRGGTNWLGIVIFLAVVIGPTLSSVLSGVISRATGVTVSSNMILGGLIVLAIVASAAGSLLRGLDKIRGSSETSLPTTPLPPPSASQLPRAPSVPTAARRMDSPSPKLSGGPKFEPIIDPRVLTFGILGLIIFGGVFLAALAFAGGI